MFSTRYRVETFRFINVYNSYVSVIIKSKITFLIITAQLYLSFSHAEREPSDQQGAACLVRERSAHPVQVKPAVNRLQETTGQDQVPLKMTCVTFKANNMNINVQTKQPIMHP